MGSRKPTEGRDPQLPRLCAAPWHPEECRRRAEEACPDGCVPGGCALAVAPSYEKMTERWSRVLERDESEALEACRDGSWGTDETAIVDALADECWLAGCPLGAPVARWRKGASVPGCPGFCDALPEGDRWERKPRWSLSGWTRALCRREVDALMSCVAGCAGEADERIAVDLVMECAATHCPSGRPWTSPSGGINKSACPGFCAVLPRREGRW